MEFVQKHWKGYGQLRDLGLEEAIISQMTQLLCFFGPIHKKRKIDLSTAEYLDHVGHLIVFLLRKAKENNKEPYRKLAAQIFPATVSLEEQRNRVITFNYDELLDKHLLSRCAPQRIYFDRLKNTRDGDERPKGKWSAPLMVKLHGSVNWQCLTADYRKIVDSGKTEELPHFLYPVWLQEKGSPAPNDEVSPCIIPPLPNKPITEISLFAYLWTKAYEYLHEAKQIVLCGYSLPATDTLAQSLFGNFRNSKLERVVVVDPDSTILTKWRALFSRRGVATPRWECFSDFTEFVENGASSLSGYWPVKPLLRWWLGLEVGAGPLLAPSPEQPYP